MVDFTAAGNANADVAGRERWAAEITSDTTARLHCRSLCVIIVLMSYVSCEFCGVGKINKGSCFLNESDALLLKNLQKKLHSPPLH